MFPIIPSTEIAQMVPLRQTNWPSDLKIEISLKDILSLNNKMAARTLDKKCIATIAHYKWFCST